MSTSPDSPTAATPGQHEFAFLDQASFLRAVRGGDPSTRTFGLAGLCWDGSTTNRPGARFGPRAIRQASHMLCDATHPHFDCSPTSHLRDFGGGAHEKPVPGTLRRALVCLGSRRPACSQNARIEFREPSLP